MEGPELLCFGRKTGGMRVYSRFLAGSVKFVDTSYVAADL